LGYALQWFSFAAILAVVYFLLIRSELQKNRHTLSKGKT